VSSIINFLIVAFVLFLIVKTMNNFVKAREQLMAGLELDEKKEVAKIRREQKVSKKEAKAIYEEKLEAAKAAKAAEEAAAAEAAAAEAARLAAEAEAKATANTKLLEEIRDLLKNK
jgi:large-conductance mechanosensitive channel